MMVLSTSLLITLIFSSALLMISLLLSKKLSNNREKSTPFECGFEPNKSARLPFSLRFFLIAVIFLIFDVEITLILPLPLILNLAPWTTSMTTITSFLIILTLGLFYEWQQGALEWA